ncbi:MAG: hypothetical protein NZ869_07905, partial [Thermoanaerobaculum sp.]|nr:hypothetical protein [Thermoanaerobaculum sp.]MDW7967696.1 helix-turn-helix domain-containing protein [Thermoanaerobaculum sp.]
ITPDLLPFAEKPQSQDLSLAALEEAHIRRVLASCGWNVSRAAQVLQIDRVTLYNKMKRYGLRRP